MGLWDFVKNAGKAIGLGDAAAAEAPAKAPAAGTAAAGSAAAATAAAEALKRQVAGLGLKVDDLKVSLDGDTVKVSGRTATQADREKVILAMGNVEGVARVDEAIETPEPAAEPVFHTVVKGDTLWKIAEKTLGKGTRYTEIFEANRPMLDDPDEIYPGQVLRIPAA